MLRVKAYHKKNKKMYKVADINFSTNTACIFEGPLGFKNYELSEFVLFQATSFFDSSKIRIYEGDFVVAKNKDGRHLSGIVSRNDYGTWVFYNKKTKKELPLYFLFVEEWEVKCLKNAFVYFKNKNKK